MRLIEKPIDTGKQLPTATLPELVANLLNDVRTLVTAEEVSSDVWTRLQFAASSIQHAVNHEFLGEHDSVRLLGQDNLRRYLPVSHLRVRVLGHESLDDLLIAAVSALAVNCRAVFSFVEQQPKVMLKRLQRLTAGWAGRIEVIMESDVELAEVIDGGGVDRLRYLSDEPEVPFEIRLVCNERFVPLICKAVVQNGYIEPLWFLQEQSISFDYHRYGNLGRRATEERRAIH